MDLLTVAQFEAGVSYIEQRNAALSG